VRSNTIADPGIQEKNLQIRHCAIKTAYAVPAPKDLENFSKNDLWLSSYYEFSKMPSSIQDVTSNYGQQMISRYGGLKKYILHQVLRGTFCFSFKRGYGCGDEWALEESKEYPVTVKFGPDFAGVTFGRIYKETSRHTFKSGKCQYCRPEVCYPNSTLKIWRCKNKISSWLWRPEEKEFTSGGSAEFNNNCKSNAPECNSEREETPSSQVGGEGRFYHADISSSTVVLIPMGFFKVDHPNEPSNSTEVVNKAEGILADSLLNKGGSDITSQSLGILLNHREDINWLYPGNVSRGKISLLSCNSTFTFGGELAIDVSDETYFPILAATQQFPNSTAEVTLTLSRPDKSEISISKPAVTKTDLVTVLWAEFDVREFYTNAVITEGMTAHIQINLKDKDQHTVGYLNETLRII
jgi:hypothetical protein